MGLRTTSYIYDALPFLLGVIQLIDAYSCWPVENGETGYMHCSINGNINNSLSWQFLLNNTYREVSSCSHGICKDKYPNLFKASMDFISEGGSVFQGTLTRFNLKRGSFLSTAKWACVHGTEYVTPLCDVIDFYKQPDKASCSDPKLIDGNTAIAVTCTAQGIFPQASCQWYLDGARRGLAMHIFDVHDTTEDWPETYLSSCTAVIQLSSISSGSYLLRVVISPGPYFWLGEFTTLETAIYV